ncbi:MAG: lauroyl acyltransferase [Sphingomonadaceae bacterium]|nr:lauroyl acyltransferase [Sphingomonadaceae bacterium]
MLSNTFLFALMRLLPATLASWIGGWLSAHVARPRMKLRDARARANLALLAPERTEAEREAILTRRWVNLGRTMAELANVDRLVNDAHVEVEDAPGYQAVLDGPRPLMALSLHIGNWDLLAAHSKAATDRPGLGVYAPPADAKTAAQLRKARESYMGEAITGKGALLRILQHLTGHPRASLFILLDERRDLQVFFPSFGRDLPVSGNMAIALRLARKAKARFLPLYLARTQGPHFRLHWHAPLDPLEMSDEAIVAAVDAYLGAASIQHADQWLALHDMDLSQQGHGPRHDAPM